MIDRLGLRAATVRYLDHQREYAADRRERNRAEGRCINENKSDAHGLATHNCRCLRCYLVHKHGSEVAREMPEWRRFRPVLPIHNESTACIQETS